MRIFQDARLIKQLRILLRSGGTAAMAARHARSIIDQLIQQGVGSPKQMGRLTKYGEARIKNCIKFDLVRAYRLVGIMQDEDIKFYFVGSHDECDRWVRHNAGIEPMLKKKDEVAIAGNEPEESVSEAGDGPEGDYDPWLHKDLSDQDLRSIFSGLCVKRATARP
ncbi:MAG: hypothetical protein LLG06_15615 [Desulfobacteraceae bacterium]|nr:hypothetical protein [Desulfobacteraceae bacterium]